MSDAIANAQRREALELIQELVESPVAKKDFAALWLARCRGTIGRPSDRGSVVRPDGADDHSVAEQS
jgi:hypothetical protein